MMDLDDFRTVLESSGVDVWTFIDTAITVASLDCLDELRRRRDGVVERLFVATLATAKCRNCEIGSSGIGIGVRKPNGHLVQGSGQQQGHSSAQNLTLEDGEKVPHGKVNRGSPSTPESGDRNDEPDPFGGLFDDEQKSVLEIKAQLEDQDQSEDSLVELLQTLADMDITFQALKETDIGRHVNRFRKHPSNEVRRLVKHLVRKWKATVDEWVNINQPGEVGGSATLLGADGDSPQQKISQNGYSKASDFGHSPNPQYGSSGSERNYSEPEAKVRPAVRRETPPKAAAHTVATSSSSQNRPGQQKESGFDLDRLASARKRLQANYKEAENAKKQRTIQVMDIHDIPKPKNTYFSKNKAAAGGSHPHAKHW